MDEIRYFNDRYRQNDKFKITNPQRINSKVSIYNDANGELIFEGHNKTVIAGSALVAMKLFDLDRECLDATPTYDEKLGLDMMDTDDTYPTKYIKDDDGRIIGSTEDEMQRKIIGFCVGQGGAGLDISDVFDVEYCSWITPDNIIPFRYPRVNEDIVDENIYKGKALKTLEGQVGDVNAYYFKEFSNTPNLVQNYVSTIGTFTDKVTAQTVYNNQAIADQAQSYVELHLKITKDDCREYFITHQGIESAKINQISLVSGWKKTVKFAKPDKTGNSVEREYEYFQDIRPFSVINIPNEIISNLEKSLSIIYTLYF